MVTLHKLVMAKLDVMTSGFSDDFDAPKRDLATYEGLLSLQTEFTDEDVTEWAGKLWNGERDVESLIWVSAGN